MVQGSWDSHVWGFFSICNLFLQCCSGHSSISADETIICVTNLENGCDLYSMPSLQKIRTFLQPITINSQIEGTLALDGLFVTGGDAGMVNIYHILSGDRISTLCHSMRKSPDSRFNSNPMVIFHLAQTLVQAVTVSFTITCFLDALLMTSCFRAYAYEGWIWATRWSHDSEQQFYHRSRGVSLRNHQSVETKRNQSFFCSFMPIMLTWIFR